MKNFRLLFLSFLIFLIFVVDTAKICPSCGIMMIPYPLSTAPNCGDSVYKIQCNDTAGSLSFIGFSGRFYPITFIAPSDNLIAIHPTLFASSPSSFIDDLPHQVPFPDSSHPFTIIGFQNFKDVDDNNETGVSSRMRIRVDIQWAPPMEPPLCKSQADCSDWPGSTCQRRKAMLNGAIQRCFCNDGMRWNPINVTCTHYIKPCKIRGDCHILAKRAGFYTAFTVTLFFFCTAAAAIAVLCLLFYCYCCRNCTDRTQQPPANEQQEGLDATTDDPAGSFTRVFTAEELGEATSGYSASKLLSSGDTGEYHEGVLADRTAIAVKHARPCVPRSRSETIRDVQILSRVDHPSLVRFLGYHLNELDHPLLVYEFVPNGDLFNWLHRLRRPLTWRRRLAIAQQAAEGLAHLFSLTPPIYHRDLKARNILLDEQLNAKVSDFGQAELVTIGIGRARAWARERLGDSYWQYHQLDFEKIDVYSFGVVLLELMTRQEVLDWTRKPSERFLAWYARRMAMEGRFMEVVEGAVKEAASEAELESMKALGLLALRCAEDLWQLRPTMKEVAEAIKNIVGVLEAAGDAAAEGG